MLPRAYKTHDGHFIPGIIKSLKSPSVQYTLCAIKKLRAGRWTKLLEDSTIYTEQQIECERLEALTWNLTTHCTWLCALLYWTMHHRTASLTIYFFLISSHLSRLKAIMMSNVTLSNVSNFLSSFKEYPIKLLKTFYLLSVRAKKQTFRERKTTWLTQ